MSNLDVLNTEFPGNDAWQRFVGVFRPVWLGRADKEKFTSAIGNSDFAIVLAATLDHQAVAWFRHPLAALEGRSPEEILTQYPDGEQILKTLIMRMPR